MAKKKINCAKCIHYFVTWDNDLPRGCKIYKSKSKLFPSHLVKKETGEDCFSFQERPKQAGKEKDLDLNSDDIW